MRFDEILSEISRRGFLKGTAAGAAAAGLGALGVYGYKNLKPKPSEYDKPAEPVDIEQTIDAVRRAQLQADEYQKISKRIIRPVDVYNRPEVPLLRAFLQAKSNASVQELAQFLAQCNAETGGFVNLDEKLGWTNLERFYNTFKKKLLNIVRLRKQDTSLSGQDHEREAYEHARELISAPEEYKRPLIANSIYANRYGNGPPETGDGWNYRGKGFLHLTFKDNYQEFGGETLVNNPDLLLTDLDWAIFTAVNFWIKKISSRIRKWDDTASITRIVNSGADANSIQKRDRLYKRYLREMPDLLKLAKTSR